jgi:uncharacterized protein (TIGR03437 family)
VVSYAAGQASTTVRTAVAAPGWFFTLDADGGSTLAATDVNGVTLTKDNPISPGAGRRSTRPVRKWPGLLVNGVAAQVLYNGGVPGFPGLGQINIVVPAATTGPVDLTVGGVHRAQAARLWIKR